MTLLLHASFTDSLTNNMYLNVHSHYVKQGALLPGQQNVTQQQFEAIALAQVRKRGLLAPFYTKIDQFTKTGSGQT
jgi:hypothetical protein